MCRRSNRHQRQGTHDFPIVIKQIIKNMNHSALIDSDKSLDRSQWRVDHCDMAHDDFEQHFRKICPLQNMQRFYSVSVCQNLFGEWCVIRNWGRIGTGGQSLQQTVDDKAQAIEIFARFTQTRRQRGYYQTS